MEEKPSKVRELFNKYHELIMYCVFGVTTTFISWLTYSIAEKALGMNLYWSGIFSWVIAVSVAFVTNKLWVFESKSWEIKLVIAELITFVGGRALTGALEVVAVPAIVALGFDMTLFGVNGLPAKILVSVLIVVLNYILSKFVSFNLTTIFRRKPKDNGEKQN